MFREMRRGRQLLPQSDAEAVLQRGTSGVLAVSGDENYPYAVPLSYAYADGKIYFHCAKTGHKMDAIKRNPKVSFCVIDQDRVVPEEYTTYFRSAIAFGHARVLEEQEEILAAMDLLAEKYAPMESQGHKQQAIANEYARLCVVEITVDHLTAKEAIELVRAR